ncbi:MAG TPA: ECF-type sigma factor [Thermoanaerobaculia bacterium]|nr:ECF-type sigma factor [Thermoanaerobaculia bacterium]
MPAQSTVTELLHAWSAGDPAAADGWVPLLYDELRRIAARHLRGERVEHTLEPTALVHEAYLRLAELRAIHWQSRSHFFAMAGRMMRRVLVDHARRLGRDKRGGGAVRVALEGAEAENGFGPGRGVGYELDLLALDAALERLTAFDPESTTVIELHFFSGLTFAETAEALGLSTATVVRRFRAAKAWLFRELAGAEPPPSHPDGP